MINSGLSFLLFLMIGLAAWAVSFRRPLTGLFILIVSLALPGRIQGLYPADALFFPISAGWLLYALLRQKLNICGKATVLFFLPFLFIAFLSKIWAGNIFQYKSNFYLWFSLPWSYLVSVNSVKTKADFRKIVYLILSVFTVFSLLYIANQFIFSGHNLFLRSRAIGFYFNTAATYLGLVLLLCLGMLAFEKEPPKEHLLLAMAGLILAALFVTGSSWGIATGLCVSLGFVIFGMPKDKIPSRRFSAILIVCAAIVVFCAMYLFDHALFQRIFSLEQKPLQQRLDMWQAGFLLLNQHPFLGTGMGWYQYYTYYFHAHNIILQVLFESGLLGLAAFFFLIGALIAYEKKRARKLSGRALCVVYSITAGFIFFGIRDMLDFTLDRGLGIFLGIMLALLEKASLLENE